MVPRHKKSLVGSIYTFKRFNTFTVGTQSAAQAGDCDVQWDDPTGYLGLKFVLNDLPNATEFSTLFDQYRIKSVRIKVTPIWNSVVADNVDAGSTSQPQVMVMTYVYDFDNISTVLDIEELNQYQRRHQKVLAGYRSKNLFVNPRAQVRVATDSGGTDTNALAKANQWQDCADLQIPFFGVRMLVKPLNLQYNPDDNFVMRLDFTYVIDFKNVR